MKSSVIKIMLVDDHIMYTESEKIALEMNPEFIICGIANDGKEAIHKTVELKPDIILMDISMKGMDGIDATEEILKRCKDQKIIIVSSYYSRGYISKSIQLGISGYVLKDDGVKTLIDAIMAVNEGDVYFSPKVMKIIIDLYRKNEYKEKNHITGLLTYNEIEALKDMAVGKRIKETAAFLGITSRQVDRYRKDFKDKLDINTPFEAANFAIREGLLKEEDIPGS
jgi:DNA-binding NarL/FixJ family response regulator